MCCYVPFVRRRFGFAFLFLLLGLGLVLTGRGGTLLTVAMSKNAVRSRTFAFLPIVTGTRVPVITIVSFCELASFVQCA